MKKNSIDSESRLVSDNADTLFIESILLDSWKS